MRDYRQHAVAHPYRTLTTAFAAWKLFLVAIVIGSCVGGAYDTSAALAVLGSDDDPATLGNLLTRFASWDAIYYVSAARRGYRFEQEWAFGTGLPIAIRGIIKALVRFGLVTETPHPGASGSQEPALLETLVGILFANAAHLLSVIVLYRLGLLLWRGHSQGALLSLLAGLLHVVSPAGLFLSTPYAESPCALFTFTGYLLYARSCHSAKPVVSDVYLVLAGVAFGLATAFRSNALLNGLPFAWEVFTLLPRLASALSPPGGKRDRDRADTPSMAVAVRRLLALGIGGAAVGAGSLIPQAVAYQRFCVDPPDGAAEALRMPRRSWCEGYLPSIYTFVQAHYWNNGFLRYWTLSNLPLFLLAAPVLAILVTSGLGYLSGRHQPAAEKGPAAALEPGRLDALIRCGAAVQVLLAALVAINSHVQIISRISSGCPMWYFWLAERVLRGEVWGKRIVGFMVVYASIQGALFASFLPPA